ncbi:MAG: heavy metal translocating P-type ATPase [Phycisphaerales bacterium]|jgi:Cu+-exporting ATPase|nr:heavy metal translocating P-type ATPase [Phycisphaerales bacterium]
MAPKDPQTIQLQVEDIHCASCVETARSALLAHSQVQEASVSVQTGRAIVKGHIDPVEAARLVTAAGYPTTVVEGARESAAEMQEQIERRAVQNERQWRGRALVGIGIWIPMAVLHWAAHPLGIAGPWIPWALGILATAVILIVGPGFFRSAWSALRRGGTNMDTLISIGAGTAWLYSLVLFVLERVGVEHGQPSYFTEAAALLGLISLGHWLEARSSARAGSAIRGLLELQPDSAERLNAAGEAQSIPLSEVVPGDHLLIKPGGRIPVDGVVVDGESEVDESLITGEPIPTLKRSGDPVVSGSANTLGRLVVKAESGGQDSTIARIARLVSDTLSSRASIQRVADRVSSIFVPAVLLVALLTITGWSILAGISGDWAPFFTGVIAAVTVLIISCPCALGLATPMAVMVGTGEAGRRGILIKSAAALERAGSVQRVIFDKTGTLTEGRPVVVSIEPAPGHDEAALLRLAAAAEHGSEHPVARAIGEVVAARGLPTPPADGFIAVPGSGVSATVEGREVVVRRDEEAACAVFADGALIGRIDVRDKPLSDAATAISAINSLGLGVEMLSGDRQESAEAIATQIGMDPAQVRAGVTPEEKAAAIRDATERVLMVGDGINDAAALATATVGVAVGSGTNVAIDAADVVIPAHRPSAVPMLIVIARRTLRTIHQNLFFAFFYNTIMIPVAAFGLLGPWGPLIAAAAMALSDITVVGNAVRLGRGLRSMKPFQTPHG